MISAAIIIERTDISLGGAERSTSELAEELLRQGVNAHILAAAGQPAQNVSVLCSQQPGQRTSLSDFKQAVQKHLSRNHYDILHSTLPFDCVDIYQPRGGSYLEAMLQNAASYHHPLLVRWKQWTHGLNRRRTAYLKAEQMACRPDAKVHIAALSDYVKQQFFRHYHLPENRVTVIANGINTQRIPDDRAAAQFRRTMLDTLPAELRPNAVLFLFAANNFRLKGLRELITGLAQAVHLRPDLPAVIVVAGSDNPSSWRKLAERRGVLSRMIFCGSRNDVISALSACDAAILPTWYDPCSRFILEALACGRPVITTQLNGASEQFHHGRHGFMIDTPANTTGLADALIQLSNSGIRSDFCQSITNDSLKDIVSIRRHVGQLRTLYDIIMTQKRG